MKDMIRKSSCVLLCIIAIAGALNAQNKLSLTDAIRLSLENNYDLVIQRNDQLIAQTRNTWGAAGRYPYVNLTGELGNSYNRNDVENYLQNQLVGGVNLGWTLFDGFSVRLNKQRLGELESLSEQTTGVLIEGTIQSVILAYYSVSLEKEKLNVYQEVMQLSEDLYTKAKLKKDIGSAVTYEVLQAQNAYLEDKSAYLLQAVNYRSAVRDLLFLLANDSIKQVELTDTFEAVPVEYKLEEQRQLMFSNNKSLKNQYINQNLLQNAVDLAKSEFYPSFNLNGGATANRARRDYEEKGIGWTTTNNFYGNFTMSFNLWGGGAKKRALKIAQIEQQSGDIGLQQMKHELDSRLQDVFESYQVRKEILGIAKENLNAARLNLQISREKYESGSINSFNFRDVQNLYLNVALRELETIYRFIDVQTSLLRLTGGIVQQYGN